jgi:hypothetical protein
MSDRVRTVTFRLFGEVGAVAVAQRDALAHDVVAEPLQIHATIMTRHGRQCRATRDIFFHFLIKVTEVTSGELPLDRL